MAKKKYIKDSRGMTVAVTTDTLGLEKPLLNENYDIDVHNINMDKIDEDLTPIDDSYIIELFQHDGDTTNPRDYYTKVEADGKFASKEDLNNIDLSNLATKEEANNALNKANEALQAGSNVKQSLVDKLTSEGLDVSTNNTFEELIGNIALGKKWASGRVGVSSSYTENFYRVNNSYTASAFYVTVKSLTFKPSVVILTSVAGSNTSVTVFNKYIDEYSCVCTASAHTTGSGGGYPFVINSSSLNTKLKVSENEFCLPVYFGGTYTWHAFE